LHALCRTGIEGGGRDIKKTDTKGTREAYTENQPRKRFEWQLFSRRICGGRSGRGVGSRGWAQAEKDDSEVNRKIGPETDSKRNAVGLRTFYHASESRGDLREGEGMDDKQVFLSENTRDKMGGGTSSSLARNGAAEKG